MQRFAGMQKHGRTPCRIECCGDFGGDVGAFANPRHHNFPSGFRQQSNRIVEVISYAFSGLA